MKIFSGKPPPTLAGPDGTLAPCPASPNCVSSRCDPSDSVHYIEPFEARGDTGKALGLLAACVGAEPRARIIAQTPGYLHAECRSAVFGFVDDLEFQVEPGGLVVHVRSAARLGHRDLGVNRKRVERVRARYFAAQPAVEHP